MSYLPEFILQSAINRGIKAFRSDRRFVDQLFKNLDQASLDQIYNFILSNAIDISINYPRSTLKVPAFVILLKSENESQAFLGDSMGMGISDEMGYDGSDEEETLGVASTSTLTGEGPLVLGPLTAQSGTPNSIVISGFTLTPDQYSGRGYTIRLLHGKGAGQIRTVLSHSTSTITVDNNWTITPDSSTIWALYAPLSEVIGQPSKLYDRAHGNDFIERRGGYYGASYQIQVIGPNPESTIFLYAILKGIFTLLRTFLEGQGIINMKMSGTDFLPRTEYMPDLAYMRALNLDFTVPFEIYEDQDPMVKRLRLIVEDQSETLVDLTLSPIGKS